MTADRFSEHQPFNSWDSYRYGQFHHQNEEERPRFSTVEGAIVSDHTAPCQNWDGDHYGQFHHQNEEERPRFSTVPEGATALDHTAPCQEHNLHYGAHPGEDWTCHDEPDGGKPRKQPSWWTHPDEHGAKKLPTAKHNEYDVLSYSKPTNGRGISDAKVFSKDTYDNANGLISNAIKDEQWESRARGTINELGDVRLDNQGDITLPGGEIFTNYQIQCGKHTLACVLVQKGIQFGSRHMRRAFHESLEGQKIVHLYRQTC